MEGLWRGWHFTMIGMKKLQDKLFGCGMYYHPMVMCVFCLPLKLSAGSVFPDAIKYSLILNTFHKICIQISSSEA